MMAAKRTNERQTGKVMPQADNSGPTLFIDGKWVPAADGRTRQIHCPADGRLVATVSEGGRAEAEQAIAAARRVFDEGSWSTSSAWDRGDLLLLVADLLVRDKDEFARAESLDTVYQAALNCVQSSLGIERASLLLFDAARTMT